MDREGILSGLEACDDTAEVEEAGAAPGLYICRIRVPDLIGGVINISYPQPIVPPSYVLALGKASVIVQYRRIARARPLPGVRVYAVGGHQGAIGVDPLKGVVIPCCHCHRAGDGTPTAGILVDSCASDDHHMGGSGVYVVFCCHRERWRSAQRSSRLIAQSALP